MSEDNGADIAVRVAGQEVNLRNVKSLNTMATVATLIIVICGFTIGWFLLDAHAKGGEKKDVDLSSVLREMVQVNREIAQGQREMNCLISLPTERRESQSDICKRIAR